MKILITRTLVILLACLLGANALSYHQPAALAAAGPDLIVQGITLSPPEPAMGDTVTITVAVKNQGDARAASSFLTCYADNTILESRLIESLDAGMMDTATFIWEATGGTHTIKAIADFNASVSETNENNNTGTYSFTTLAADLIIQSITWLPASPSKGENVTFSVTIKNQGTYKSSHTSVNFFIDGGTRGLQDVSAIKPGETATKTYSWVALAGEHTLRAVIDEINNIKESNETNNDLSITFSTLPPDLTIQDIAWTPANPSKNDTVTFTVTVKNQGLGRADASHLGYFIDGEFMSAISVPALNADASCDVTFDWIASVDAHDIRAVIDYYRLINESSETNNELQVSLLTLTPDLIISNLTWLPVTAAAGDTVTFKAYLKNTGGGTAEASRAVLYIDGKMSGYLDFPAVAAGAEQTATLTWTAEGGSHAVSITADYAQKIKESREDNNRYNATVPILPPDLIVTGISFAPEKPSIGDTVTFTITVENQGSGDATSFKIAHYIDDEIISVSTIGLMESGASEDVSCTWEIQNGRYVFKASADYDNALLEENEKNNSATVTVMPNMPDLSVTNVTWSPPEITAGQEIVFIIDIENTGNLEAGASRIAYYVDDAIAGFNDIGNIAAGEKAPQQFIWAATEGTHTISIVADAKAQVTEIDETNNTIKVNIPPPDLTVQEITFSTQEVTTGDMIVITTSVKNQGANRSPNSTAACYVDGLIIGSNAVPEIEAGESYESSFDWPAGPGAHTIKISVDISNTVIETDETNNDKEAVFSAMTPDLAIGSVSWLADNQLSSNEVNFTVIVENAGTVPSGEFSIEYRFDDANETTCKMASVPAGGTVEFTFIAILSVGQHSANITLDAENEISELDETNNESVLSFSTTAPDLFIRSITWEPLTAKIGDNITISAKVENRGGEKATDTRFSLSVDGVATGFIDIPEIGAGATATADFSWTAAEGEHEIVITADADGLIQESNETNNTKNRTISFTKQEAPAKKAPVINTGATTGGGLLETWWWLLLLVGGVLGLGLLYTTIKNMRRR